MTFGDCQLCPSPPLLNHTPKDHDWPHALSHALHWLADHKAGMSWRRLEGLILAVTTIVKAVVTQLYLLGTKARDGLQKYVLGRHTGDTGSIRKTHVAGARFSS